MSNLELVKSEKFGEVTADIYSNGDDMFMTINQLAECLEYSNKSGIEKIVQRNEYLKNNEFSTTDRLSVVEGGRNVARERMIFTEDGIYEITMLSGQPKAKLFHAWIRKVIKSIRKHGAYMTPETIEKALLNPDTIIQIATALKTEQEKRAALEMETTQQKQIIGELQPKVTYYDVILNNKGLVTITQIAKDYGMSGQAMNKLLHELGVQYEQSGQWLLYRKYHNEGYTHSKTIPIKHKDGTKDVTMQTKWTQKGRLFIYDLLKKNSVLPVIEKSA